jgi:RND family efflux transporter MFP subunit
MKHRSVIISKMIGIVLLSAAAVLWGWPDGQEAAVRPTAARLVETGTVQQLEADRTVRLSGVTRAAQRATLSFAVPGRLVRRPVEIGDTVRQGQVLADLDAREYGHAVASAQAAAAELRVRLAQSLRDRRRIERLAAAKAATAEEREQVAAAAEALAAAVAAAEARLADARRVEGEARITAPFDGTVTAVRVEPGEWVGPGKPVVQLAGDGDVELKVDVPESIVTRLAVDDRVTVRLPFANHRSLTGRIASVARAAASVGRLFPVVVVLAPDQKVVAGMTAELIVALDTEPALTVPLEAVVNPGSSTPGVFCVRRDRVQRVPVRLGQLTGGRITVKGDLSPGDRVVVSGHTRLSEGDVVEVRT